MLADGLTIEAELIGRAVEVSILHETALERLGVVPGEPGK